MARWKRCKKKLAIYDNLLRVRTKFRHRMLPLHLTVFRYWLINFHRTSEQRKQPVIQKPFGRWRNKVCKTSSFITNWGCRHNKEPHILPPCFFTGRRRNKCLCSKSKREIVPYQIMMSSELLKDSELREKLLYVATISNFRVNGRFK